MLLQLNEAPVTESNTEQTKTTSALQTKQTKANELKLSG